MEDATYRLRKPIQRGSERIETLTFHELTLKDLRQLDGVKGETAKTIKVISLMTQLSESEVESIGSRDFARIAKVVADFFEDGEG